MSISEMIDVYTSLVSPSSSRTTKPVVISSSVKTGPSRNGTSAGAVYGVRIDTDTLFRIIYLAVDALRSHFFRCIVHICSKHNKRRPSWIRLYIRGSRRGQCISLVELQLLVREEEGGVDKDVEPRDERLHVSYLRCFEPASPGRTIKKASKPRNSPWLTAMGPFHPSVSSTDRYTDLLVS